jgi:hypothetical protein
VTDTPTSPSLSAQARPRRSYSREERAKYLDLFAEMGAVVPELDRAIPLGVPRSTLRSWQQQQARLAACPERVAFFESLAGQAFLLGLLLALTLTLLGGPYGLRGVQQVLRLSGLDVFVASSLGSIHTFVQSLVVAITSFGKQEEERLVQTHGQAPKVPVFLSPDELFRPGALLVALDAISGYVFTAAHSGTRSAEAWLQTLTPRLEQLPVELLGAIADQGKGLTCALEEGLGVGKFHDLFHAMLELTRAAGAVLARRVAHAQKDLDSLRPADRSGKAASPPQVAEPERLSELAEKVLVAVEQQQAWQEAKQGLSSALHPYDLKTAAPRSESHVEQEMNEHLDRAEELIASADLPQRAQKAVSKVRAMVPTMACQLSFFHSYVAEQLEKLCLPTAARKQVRRWLLPACYLEQVATRVATAAERESLADRAEEWRTKAYASSSAFGKLPLGTRMAVERVCRRTVMAFQRASSAVEGFNGKLSLFARLWHSLPPERVEALKVLHNHFVRRADGTTAAERLFGTSSHDLFAYLLEHVQLPPRPRTPPARPTCSDAQLN